MESLSHAFYQQARDEQPRVPQEWGRAEAFERLYEDQHARIYNLAARVLGDVDEAADVTQDVFLKAFREMPALPRDVDMERWMYRVTVNACFDLLRRRRTRVTSPLHDLDEMPALGDGLERAQLTHAVEAALADLNPRYRTALVLKDLHGLGNGEVADIMGIGRNTTGVLVFRARAAFRRAFGKASPVGAGPAAGLGLAAFLPTLPVPAATADAAAVPSTICACSGCARCVAHDRRRAVDRSGAGGRRPSRRRRAHQDRRSPHGQGGACGHRRHRRRRRRDRHTRREPGCRPRRRCHHCGARHGPDRRPRRIRLRSDDREQRRRRA